MPFDKAYYQRFYHDPRTAVTSRAEMRSRAELIAACVNYLGLPVKRILDAGCGVGLMRAPRTLWLRSATWSRRELARAFEPLGCGMWLRRGAPVTLWDLDGARR